jgi:hypothetical protein
MGAPGPSGSPLLRTNARPPSRPDLSNNASPAARVSTTAAPRRPNTLPGLLARSLGLLPRGLCSLHRHELLLRKCDGGDTLPFELGELTLQFRLVIALERLELTAQFGDSRLRLRIGLVGGRLHRERCQALLRVAEP